MFPKTPLHALVLKGKGYQGQHHHQLVDEESSLASPGRGSVAQGQPQPPPSWDRDPFEVVIVVSTCSSEDTTGLVAWAAEMPRVRALAKANGAMRCQFKQIGFMVINR